MGVLLLAPFAEYCFILSLIQVKKYIWPVVRNIGIYWQYLPLKENFDLDTYDPNWLYWADLYLLVSLYLNYKNTKNIESIIRIFNFIFRTLSLPLIIYCLVNVKGYENLIKPFVEITQNFKHSLDNGDLAD